MRSPMRTGTLSLALAALLATASCDKLGGGADPAPTAGRVPSAGPRKDDGAAAPRAGYVPQAMVPTPVVRSAALPPPPHTPDPPEAVTPAQAESVQLAAGSSDEGAQ